MKQKSLLDFVDEKHKCKYCDRKFATEKGLKIHSTKAHFFYHDENVEVVEVDANHIQLNVKIRKTLFQDLMKTVERSGADLCRLLSEAFIMGDILFDKEVRKYAAQKNLILPLLEAGAKGKEPTYIR